MQRTIKDPEEEKRGGVGSGEGGVEEVEEIGLPSPRHAAFFDEEEEAPVTEELVGEDDLLGFHQERDVD